MKRTYSSTTVAPYKKRKQYVQRVPRPRFSSRGGVHVIKRMASTQFSLWSNTGISINVATASGGYYTMGVNYSLQNIGYNVNNTSIVTAIPGIADLTSLFDSWRIKKVITRVYFSNNNSSLNSPSLGLPIIYHAIDDDSSNEEVTVSNIQQIHNTRVSQLGGGSSGNSMFSRSLYPKAALVGTGTSQMVAPGNQWIDCATPLAQTYGLKLAYDNSLNATAVDTKVGVMTLVHEVIFELKSTR